MTAKRVTFKLNGVTLEAPEGQLVIEAAKAAGVEIPHYCYHPALGNPGNCRLCVVEVAGAPKPMVSCRTQVREGLEVYTDSEPARRAQASSLELHLVNHPLDCPVCDQSGECGLQDYYMKFGRYDSQVREAKEHKRKRLEIGPHVMLDQERCVLCTRCTRFTEKITKTSELGIFGRGHKEFVDLAPGQRLDNAYSGNTVDLCPVGALTDKDFRFKVRVWYLDQTPSICADCSRGCNVSLHTNTKRPWHDEGRRLARVKPRHNPEVNQWWLCDEGRYGFKKFDEDRLGRVMRLIPYRRELAWETALDELASELRRELEALGPEGLAVVASGALSNEDWAAFKAFFVDALGCKRFLFAPQPDQLGIEDDLLRRKEKVPNLEGGKALGFGSAVASLSWERLEADLEAGKIWGLYLIERDAARFWGAKASALLSKPRLVVWQGPWKGRTGELAHFRLPATAHIEEDGHFTNFEGRIQAYQKALEPLGQARPDWSIFEGLRQRLGAAQKAAR
ncbi:MAG: (2Fe-2S)-binding protein [Elusimicrobia bacterium]|nr:(2Fe-2S)-binding protein [Elusimicrobiota bacterium]MDE2236430.1 (2Fe-2S)-binding protein [Elusimicrobiota bacterium]MDE2424766.1 (2Fe-2S)-binding protein [Elusimicrobiota bacterium]